MSKLWDLGGQTKRKKERKKEFKGKQYHYSIIYCPHQSHQKRLLDSCHPHFHNHLQASCHRSIPIREKFYHTLNITLTNFLNDFVTNIRGQTVQFFNIYFRIYHFNVLGTARTLFSVISGPVPPTAKIYFLADITMLQNITFAVLITMVGVVCAIESKNLININC